MKRFATYMIGALCGAMLSLPASASTALSSTELLSSCPTEDCVALSLSSSAPESNSNYSELALDTEDAVALGVVGAVVVTAIVCSSQHSDPCPPPAPPRREPIPRHSHHHGPSHGHVAHHGSHHGPSRGHVAHHGSHHGPSRGQVAHHGSHHEPSRGQIAHHSNHRR